MTSHGGGREGARAVNYPCCRGVKLARSSIGAGRLKPELEEGRLHFFRRAPAIFICDEYFADPSEGPMLTHLERSLTRPRKEVEYSQRLLQVIS
jgi:hypothetical protein